MPLRASRGVYRVGWKAHTIALFPVQVLLEGRNEKDCCYDCDKASSGEAIFFPYPFTDVSDSLVEVSERGHIHVTMGMLPGPL